MSYNTDGAVHTKEMPSMANPSVVVDNPESQVNKILTSIQPRTRLPADTIIDYYKLAKETGNPQLMDLVRTLQVRENMKKSELKKVIKEIVKGVFKEMSTTGAASPVSTPFAFSKRKVREAKPKSDDDEGGLDSGDSTESGGEFRPDESKVKETSVISPKEEADMDINGAKNVANSVYGSIYLVRPYSKSLDGKTEFFEVKLYSATGPKKYLYKQVKGGEWFYSVGYGAESKWQLFNPSAVNEMTGTDACTGYNVPSAFSRKGGSKRGVAGSRALGYTLTPDGEKEMQRVGDKL